MDDIDLSGLFEGLAYLIAEVPELVVLAVTTVWGWIITLTLVAFIWLACQHNANVRRERLEQESQQVEQVAAPE